MDTLLTKDSLASQKPCRLFALAQELQDLIFAFAYPKFDSNVEIIFKHDWDESQEHFKKSPGLSFLVEPFPEPKVAEWLVSKAYFISAARAYMQAQDWEHAASDFLAQRNGLFCQYAQNIATVPASELPRLLACQTLRKLEIWIKDDVFDAIVDKELWVDEYGPADFEKLAITRDVRALRLGLKGFSLTAVLCHFTMTEAREQRLAENVKALEEFLWPDVRVSKVQVGVETDNRGHGRAMPLYLGSRVCERRSELLPERPAWTERPL